MSVCFVCDKEAVGHPTLYINDKWKHVDGTTLCNPYNEIQKLRALLQRIGAAQYTEVVSCCVRTKAYPDGCGKCIQCAARLIVGEKRCGHTRG